MSTAPTLGANFKGRSFLNALAKWILNKTADRDFLLKLGGIYDVGYAGMHMTYNELNELNLIPRDSEVIGLATVRNPFTRAVSIFKHRKEKGVEMTPGNFEDFCFDWIAKPSLKHNVICFQRTQADFIFDRKGRPFTDNIIRFENLQGDYDDFCRRYEIPLVKLKEIGKNAGPHWRDLHTSKTIDWVKDFYQDDFENFGYPLDIDEGV